MNAVILQLAARARTPGEARAFLTRVLKVSGNARGGVSRGREASRPIWGEKSNSRAFAGSLRAKGSEEAEEKEGVDLVRAFETDMEPLRTALVEALQAGDMDAMRGLRAMLPGFLGGSEALAEVLAGAIGREVVGSLQSRTCGTVFRGDELEGDEEPLVNGVWKKELHPTGKNGRFVESKIKAEIQRGRNAIWRVVAEETDVIAAIHREEIGDIDFLWDHKGCGIKHLLERRAHQDTVRPDLNKFSPNELLDRVPEVILRGKITPAGNKIEIDHKGIRVILARRDGKSANAWMMSGFEMDANSRRKGGSR